MDEKTFNTVRDRLQRVKLGLVGARFEPERASIDKAIGELYHQYKAAQAEIKKKDPLRAMGGEDYYTLREKEKKTLRDQFVKKLEDALMVTECFRKNIVMHENFDYADIAQKRAKELNEELHRIYDQYRRIS